ncbi:MAG: M48 family metallopeptidase [Methanolobus sp.]
MKFQASIRDMVIDYELVPGDVKNVRLEFNNEQLFLVVPDTKMGHIDHEKIVQRHRRWIYNRFLKLHRLKNISENICLVNDRSLEEFKELVKSIVTCTGDELGVKPEKVRFRKMKTKWGSCSSKGNLNFNSHMRHLPESMVEYIVFHEMVHLIELNHSQRFWNHIKIRFPDYKEYEAKLAAYWSLIQKQCFPQSL